MKKKTILMLNIILRHKISWLTSEIQQGQPSGVILSGVIGSGKTTVAEQVCQNLKAAGYDVLAFDGDDVQFRTAIRANTRLFVDEIVQNGLERPLIFVDEVQKEPEIFDAIKMAFDKQKASFIVTGSNPAFLHLEAQNRLQRRGTRVSLFPLSIPEIAVHKKIIKTFDMEPFTHLLWSNKSPLMEPLPQIRRPPEIVEIAKQYLIKGGASSRSKESKYQPRSVTYTTVGRARSYRYLSSHYCHRRRNKTPSSGKQ